MKETERELKESNQSLLDMLKELQGNSSETNEALTEFIQFLEEV